jgi:dihydropyrimidine dehydrogenase (NADP+)/dihydropyrimidine dehydrogenase (NAD+) subunit PreA
MTMEIATLIRDHYPAASLSGIGGIETGEDAAEFILLGADTVQVCTGVMKHGYKLVQTMSEQLLAFMEKHGFETIDDFKGKALPYFTSHSDLVARQAKAKADKAAAKKSAKGITTDEAWDGDDFVKQSDDLVGN